MASSSDTDISVYGFVYKPKSGDIGPDPYRVKVNRNADVLDLHAAFLSHPGVNLALLRDPSGIPHLWKPLQSLARDSTGGIDLRSRLREHELDLNKFCVNLHEGDWPEKKVFEVLNLNPSRPRNAQATSLVVEIRPEVTVLEPALQADLHEGDEECDVVTLMTKEFTHSRGVTRESPSQSAKPASYLEHQNGSAPILDGRYGDYPTSLALPIEIYHPAFAAFVGYSRDDALAPPEDLVVAASKFMNVVSQIVPQERNRKSTREHLTHLMDIVIDQNINKNKTVADHYVTYDRETRPLVKAALGIIEEKAELGQSNDPSVQGEFSYVHYWNQPDRRELSDACFCPSFIISVAGPWFSVCGGIYTTHPIVQRLSSFEWLSRSRTIDSDHVHRVSRIFYALRLAIGQLREWYKTLVVPDIGLGPSPTRFFPLANTCRLSDNEVLQFCYEKPLKGSKPDPECVAFLVSDCRDRSRRYVVKFVESYGADAHRLLAMHGYAPKLLYHGPIWPSELVRGGVGSRMMVVMEFIEGKTTVKRYPDGSIPQGVVDAVEAAMNLLHEKKMVYGDLREPNIMVVDGVAEGKEKEGTKIVDFDWAGIEGEVRYPFQLSDAVKGDIEGVDDFMLIEASHDRARLKKLRSMVKKM